MVLSGYLFAKLLDRQHISYPAFFWNRFIRLAPLLVLTFILVGIERYFRGSSVISFFLGLYRGLIYPVWPNGGWSITTEIHFYLLLPFLLALTRRSRLLPIAIVVAAITFRILYFYVSGEVQGAAYWTILGRIDQFVLGMMGFFFAPEMKRFPRTLLTTFLAFSAFWWWFNVTGGFYLRPTYPSPSAIWICIPTIEGVAWTALVTWYDANAARGRTIGSRLAQRLGEYSYSIYLLHFFVVFKVARYVHENVMNISNFYVGLVWATAFFLCMLVPGYLSYRFVESPFLRLRLNYIREHPSAKKGTLMID